MTVKYDSLPSMEVVAGLQEATRQFQSALETARRIKHEAELTMTPIEAAPLIATVEAEVAVYRERMDTAFKLTRSPGCSVMGDK